MCILADRIIVLIGVYVWVTFASRSSGYFGCNKMISKHDYGQKVCWNEEKRKKTHCQHWCYVPSFLICFVGSSIKESSLVVGFSLLRGIRRRSGWRWTIDNNVSLAPSTSLLIRRHIGDWRQTSFEIINEYYGINIKAMGTTYKIGDIRPPTCTLCAHFYCFVRYSMEISGHNNGIDQSILRTLYSSSAQLLFYLHILLFIRGWGEVRRTLALAVLPRELRIYFAGKWNEMTLLIYSDSW